MSALLVPALLVLVPALLVPATAVVPQFVMSSNMALVLVPSDVTVNTTIYRVKATDGDSDYPLQFLLPGEYTG